MRIYTDAAGFTVVEGELEQLLAAGVLRPDDSIPQQPGGYCDAREGARVSRLRGGTLRVRGRHLEAARGDVDFRFFLARLTPTSTP